MKWNGIKCCGFIMLVVSRNCTTCKTTILMFAASNTVKASWRLLIASMQLIAFEEHWYHYGSIEVGPDHSCYRNRRITCTHPFISSCMVISSIALFSQNKQNPRLICTCSDALLIYFSPYTRKIVYPFSLFGLQLHACSHPKTVHC